MTNLTFGPSNC